MTDWDKRYLAGDTPWEKGRAAPPLGELLLKMDPAAWGNGPLLVPGCGLGHDVRALAALGRSVLGVDLAATLSTGKLVAERGVLAAADGGVIVVPMAERLSIAARTALCEVLDHAEVQVARDGIGERHAARICALVMDESIDDEAVHAALRDRLAFVVRLSGAAADALLDEALAG